MKQLLLPHLCCQRQLVEFGASFAPGRVVLLKNRDEAVAVGWLQQVSHFMDDDVFEQVLGLLDEFRVKSDMPDPVIAASPPGFHPLQEVSSHPHP